MHSTRQTTTRQSRKLATTRPDGPVTSQYVRGHVPMPAPTYGDTDSNVTAEPEPSTRRLIRGHVTMSADGNAGTYETTGAGLLPREPSEVTYPDLSDFEAQQSDDDAGPPEPLIPMRRPSGDSIADILRDLDDFATKQAQAAIGGRMADKQKRESSRTAFEEAMSDLLSIIHINDDSVRARDRALSKEHYHLLYPTWRLRRNEGLPYDAEEMKEESRLWSDLQARVSAWRKKREEHMRRDAEDRPTRASPDRSRSGNFVDTRGLPTLEGTYPSQDHHSHDRVLRPGETITTQHNGIHYHLRGPEMR